MKNTWQLQEARNRLTTFVEGALHHGPQIITRRGVKTAIVLSVKDYEKLAKTKQNLVDFFKSSPLHGVKIDLTRSKDSSREVEF